MSMAAGCKWDAKVMLRLLSEERMSTYLAAAKGNFDDAFTLYSRNIQIAATLQGMTAMVEVVARNAIDQALTKWSARKHPCTDWFDLDILDGRAQKDIATARQRVHRSGKPETHSKVLAELSFGFWRFLTSKRYLTSLWTPALQHAFPNGHKDIWTRQKQVAALLTDMNFIRNRAAHLEPVFKRNLKKDFENAHRLLCWIDPNAAAWLKENATIVQLLDSDSGEVKCPRFCSV